jgi:hypothetical protein
MDITFVPDMYAAWQSHRLSHSFMGVCEIKSVLQQEGTISDKL